MSYLPGMAWGPTSIILEDGTRWFWYHQSNHDCSNNAFIDEIGVRISDIHYRYKSDYKDEMSFEYKKLRSLCWQTACSSYSISLALANLIGKDYNIYDLWKDLDADMPTKSPDWDNEYQIDVTSQINGVGRDLIQNPAVLSSKLTRKYPLLKIQDVSTWDKERLDALMDDPDSYSMITINQKRSSICDSDGHFLTLFRKTGDKYGILTSAANPYGDEHSDYVKLSSRLLSWKELTEGLRYFNIAFTMDKKYYDQ